MLCRRAVVAVGGVEEEGRWTGGGVGSRSGGEEEKGDVEEGSGGRERRPR
jgi:hypothetical protein